MKIATVACCGRSNTMQLYTGVLFLLLQLSFTTAKHYYDVMGEPSVTYELVCPENEELRDTMPCCEPTCSNDCTTAKCSKTYVHQPTCVCKEGYVRHKGKCILLLHCPPKPPSPLTCGENEELLPSPPSCEPTCTEDCAGRPVHSRYVDQPTCVCKKGYRRHRGKCIRVDQCPSCGPYATLKANVPCCEPTCDNDCRNVLCIDAYESEEPVCVCQDGYVKHNSTCIKRELCPQTTYPGSVQYCRCGVKQKQKGRVPIPVKYVEMNTPAPCSCYKPPVNDGRLSDYYPAATYSPMSYPAMNFALIAHEVTTCAPPPPPPAYQPLGYVPPVYQQQNYAPPATCAPPKYVPGPYVPPPTYAPPKYVADPYVPPPTCEPPKYVADPYVPPSTCAPPKYASGSYAPPPAYASPVYIQPPTTTCAPPVASSNQYYRQPVYDVATNYVPPPPPPAYAYTPPPVVESSTQSPYPYAPVTMQPYYQQPPSSYQDRPYYAMPALKQCSCNINAGSPCGCGKGQDAYSSHTQTYNRPPISYNVMTPSTTTAVPTTTFCPACCSCNQCQPYGPSSHQKDQPYMQQPCTTREPQPVDVSYIALSTTSCSPFNTV